MDYKNLIFTLILFILPTNTLSKIQINRDCLPLETIDCSTSIMKLIPKIGDAFTVSDEIFADACIIHDYCYRFGHKTYGYNQNQCDSMFLEDMLKICSSSHPENSMESLLKLIQPSCNVMAYLYYRGVYELGSDSFNKENKTCDYEKILLDQIVSSNHIFNGIDTLRLARATSMAKNLINPKIKSAPQFILNFIYHELDSLGQKNASYQNKIEEIDNHLTEILVDLNKIHSYSFDKLFDMLIYIDLSEIDLNNIRIELLKTMFKFKQMVSPSVCYSDMHSLIIYTLIDSELNKYKLNKLNHDKMNLIIDEKPNFLEHIKKIDSEIYSNQIISKEFDSKSDFEVDKAKRIMESSYFKTIFDIYADECGVIFDGEFISSSTSIREFIFSIENDLICEPNLYLYNKFKYDLNQLNKLVMEKKDQCIKQKEFTAECYRYKSYQNHLLLSQQYLFFKEKYCSILKKSEIAEKQIKQKISSQIHEYFLKNYINSDPSTDRKIETMVRIDGLISEITSFSFMEMNEKFDSITIKSFLNLLLKIEKELKNNEFKSELELEYSILEEDKNRLILEYIEELDKNKVKEETKLIINKTYILILRSKWMRSIFFNL